VLRADPDIDLWQHAARRLRAATAQEQNRSRRHAALALLLSDALSFTSPDDPHDGAAARSALALGWRALSEPFISAETERQIALRLVAAGWQITLPYRGWAAGA
jgi:hypothetical protein